MTILRDFLAVPFGWALGVFYNLSGNYLLSLVIITLVLKLLLLPLGIKQQKGAAKQMRLQAKVNKIRAKYAGAGREGQMKISEETQELYRREGFNPASAGCAPMLLQLVVMMGLYGAIYSPISKVLMFKDAVIEELTRVYLTLPGLPENAAKGTYRMELNILNRFSDIIPNLDTSIVSQETVEKIQSFISHFTIFGVNLTELPKNFKGRDDAAALILIPVLAGVSAMLTAVYSYVKQRKTNPETAKNPAMGCMMLFSPALSIYFAYSLPAGVEFYWIISNILAFIQTIALAVAIKPEKVIAGQMIDETVERRSREASIKKRVAFSKDKKE